MSQPLDEKTALEKAAVEQFAEVFTASTRRGVLQFVELLPAPQPDARCTLNGKDVFVEVAHVYGTESDARLLLGRTGYAAPTDAEQNQSSLLPLNFRVLATLNMVLAQKSRRRTRRRLFGSWCAMRFRCDAIVTSSGIVAKSSFRNRIYSPKSGSFAARAPSSDSCIWTMRHNHAMQTDAVSARYFFALTSAADRER